MDRRTANLLDSLTHPGAAVLAALLAGDATEAELATQVDAPQPTVHRRLHRLEELGLVTRPPGAWRAPNRPYRIAVPDQVGALLLAAAAASQALAAAEDRARAAMVEGLSKPPRSRLRRVE